MSLCDGCGYVPCACPGMTKEQYQNTKWLRDSFRDVLKSLRRHPVRNIAPKIRQAQLDAIVSQIRDLEQQMAAYKGKKT